MSWNPDKLCFAHILWFKLPGANCQHPPLPSLHRFHHLPPGDEANLVAESEIWDVASCAMFTMVRLTLAFSWQIRCCKWKMSKSEQNITMEHHYALCLNILKTSWKHHQKNKIMNHMNPEYVMNCITTLLDIYKHIPLTETWHLPTSPCPHRFEVKVRHLPKRPGFQWVANCHSRPHGGRRIFHDQMWVDQKIHVGQTHFGDTNSMKFWHQRFFETTATKKTTITSS